MKLVKPNWVTHDGSPIFSVDIHPDGKRFVTGGQGEDCGRVVIWNMEPVLKEESEADENIPKLLCQMDHHLACVNCVRFNSSGLLASGGDDKIIMIWKFYPGAQQNNLFGSKSSVETWRCKATLRGHNGDILDFAWSPFNEWLASASIDNTVIVWDVPKKMPIVCLRGHTGLVKGVTWDPIGKYLASQSDDKSLRIWRTSDWREETVITEPFTECGGTTHVLRLSWSPDGQYLVSAHAMNGGGPTAQIIEREEWKTEKDFVGHRKAVTCVRFNAKIFEKINDAKKPVQFCCAAIGSRDRSLSVWSTCLQRPLVVIHEVFVSSVLDICWSPCGLRLCACSKDGTVVFVEFSEKELGQPLSPSQVIGIQERLYGKLNKQYFAIIEDPEILKVKKSSPEPDRKSKKPEISAEPENKKITNSSSAAPSVTGTRKQIETRTADGKRRITPLFISSQSEAMETESNISTVPTAGASSSTVFSSTSRPNHSTIQVEKRDEVVEPNVSSKESDTDPPLRRNIFEKLKPIDGIPKSQIEPIDKKNQIPVERGAGAILLPSLKPNKNIMRQAGNFSVSCVTSDSLSHLQCWHGTETESAWDHYLGYIPNSVAITPTVVAVSCEDGSLHIFETIRGARLVPPIVPPAPIAKLYANGNMVMIISCTAEVRVWEVSKSLCRLFISTSAAHLITPTIALMKCELHNGQPNLIFTNARAYMYHKEMDTWLLMGDSNDPVWRWHAVNALDSTNLKGRAPIGPLGRLQEGLNRIAGRVLPFFKIPKAGACIIAYFEQQVLASKALDSTEEYKIWLLQLVNFLSTHEHNENRLRIILDELLGPSHSSAQLSQWESEILGISKHTLLEEALHVIATNVRYQRLYVEYNDQLQDLKAGL